MKVKDFTDVKQISEAQQHLANEQAISTTVYSCPKCNGTHEALEFKKLKVVVTEGNITITHVGECPQTGLQLKISWLPPEAVAAKERAIRTMEVGQQLNVEGMSDEDIEKVLQALRELGA